MLQFICGLPILHIEKYPTDIFKTEIKSFT